MITNEWTKDKPNIPCVFVARSKHGKYKDNPEHYEYELVKALWIDDGNYLGYCDNYGDEQGDLTTDLIADEYLIIEILK
jgi:hypothetical protein